MKTTRNRPKATTLVSSVAELERMRTQSAGAVPLLVDDPEDEAAEVIPPISAGSELLPSNVRASIEIVSGPSAGVTFSLMHVETRIGRESSPVPIDDPQLSRHHATLIYAGDHFRVREIGSANGTYLNGARVTDYPLKDGDQLLLGGTTVRFHTSRDR